MKLKDIGKKNTPREFQRWRISLQAIMSQLLPKFDCILLEVGFRRHLCCFITNLHSSQALFQSIVLYFIFGRFFNKEVKNTIILKV
jgi:hypothetical protein